MVGLLTLSGKIISNTEKEVSERIILEKNLIGQIFKDFLFSTYYSQANEMEDDKEQITLTQKVGSRADTKSPEVDNEKSREAAYALLIKLLRSNPAFFKKFISNDLLPLVKGIQRPRLWGHEVASKSDREQKYVGLVNLGCICYMISMLQQFFMVPAFRYNLLCVEDGKEEDL